MSQCEGCCFFVFHLATDCACHAEDKRGRLFSYAAACPQAVEWPPLITAVYNSVLFGQMSLTLSLRSMGKRMGTQKRKPMTLLGPRSREGTCVELVCGYGGEWRLHSRNTSLELSYGV